MNLSPKFFIGSIAFIVFSNAYAEISDEELQNRDVAQRALQRLRQESYKRTLKHMEMELPEFKLASKNNNLVAFLMKIKSESEREVLRTVKGTLPSDALSYAPELAPPGIYLIGILRPNSVDSFVRSGETKTFAARVFKNYKEGSKELMQSDLSELLGVPKEAEQNGGGQPATRSESK